MTRLTILSDIHGNLPALEAVQQDLSQFQVDHVIVAGDVIDRGPFSAPVNRRRWAVSVSGDVRLCHELDAAGIGARKTHR